MEVVRDEGIETPSAAEGKSGLSFVRCCWSNCNPLPLKRRFVWVGRVRKTRRMALRRRLLFHLRGVLLGKERQRKKRRQREREQALNSTRQEVGTTTLSSFSFLTSRFLPLYRYKIARSPKTQCK